MQFTLDHYVTVLLIAGALNWGVVASGQQDLVKKFLPDFDVYVKMIIAIAGVYALYKLIEQFTA